MTLLMPFMVSADPDPELHVCRCPALAGKHPRPPAAPPSAERQLRRRRGQRPRGEDGSGDPKADSQWAPPGRKPLPPRAYALQNSDT